MPRKPKKDETLEVRLPHETKHAFMERCKAEGRTASEAVRGFIEEHLARPFETKEPNMKLPRTIPMALAAGAAMATVTLFAAQPSRAGPDLQAAYKIMDVNEDGQVTVQEFTTHPGRAKQVMFLRDGENGAAQPPPDAKDLKFVLPLEKPKDGEFKLPPGMRTVSPEARVKMEQQIFAEIDADGDGKVSFGEYEKHHLDLVRNSFARLDKNRDGAVTQAEFDAPPAFTAGVRVEPGKPLPKLPTPPELFSKLDKNKDGRISEKEFLEQG